MSLIQKQRFRTRIGNKTSRSNNVHDFSSMATLNSGDVRWSFQTISKAADSYVAHLIIVRTVAPFDVGTHETAAIEAILALFRALN